MHKELSLAIVIPTFGRSDLLREGLERMQTDLVRLRIPVYVSDDSVDDLTKKMIAELSADTSIDLRYRRNKPSLGHDKNIIESLLWPAEDYVWIIGDSGWVVPGALDKVAAMAGTADLIFVNSHATSDVDIIEAKGEAALALIRGRLWHQTLTGATVYSRSVLKWLSFERTRSFKCHRNFPQLSVILGFASAIPCCVSWVSEQVVRYSEKKKSYWRSKVLSVFVDDWADVVSGYPSVIKKSQVPAILKSHSAGTGLFSIGVLIDLRQEQYLTWSYVLPRRRYFFHVMHLPMAVVISVMTLPLKVVLGMRKLNRLAGGRNRGAIGTHPHTSPHLFSSSGSERR